MTIEGLHGEVIVQVNSQQEGEVSAKSEQVVVGYRVPKSIVDWLRDKAEREERSQNWMVNRILRDAMEADERGAAA